MARVGPKIYHYKKGKVAKVEERNPKQKSKGKCPKCGWPVKRGGIRRTVNGVRRWYHPSCYKG